MTDQGTASDLVARVEDLLDRLEPLVGRDETDALRARLREPLRIAIAGRVKAGKSTLLNALVGEKLAATDAGECTRVVAWYRDGPFYEVRLDLADGTSQTVPFRRADGALEVDLGGRAVSEIERVDVRCPSASLREVTLIDTPGLASLDDSASIRTRDFLGVEDDRPSEADAVIYLMRHMHRHDAEFLDAFTDHSLVNASPVNAVGVLSRADEIGAGRVDAMVSAHRIAARYGADDRVRELCIGVVPVSGLTAETGLTLTESEAASLRVLAAHGDEPLGSMLLSADRFVASAAISDLSPELRTALLARLGMFGLRSCVRWIRAGEASTATDLARLLVESSGLDELRSLLREHFLPRSQALRVRSVLVALRARARRVSSSDPSLAAAIESALEPIEVGAHELAELRLAHLLHTGMVRFGDEERDEVGRLLRGGAVTTRLGLGHDAGEDAVRSTALAGIERWRHLTGTATLDPSRHEACDTLIRTYEGIYAAAFAATSTVVEETVP
jgi:hypothetical protein